MGTDADAMPSRVGPWEIVLPIASGRMGTVYLARPLSPADAPKGSPSDRYFALKLVASRARSDPGFARRLLEEASLTRELRHPNVTAAFDVGKCDDGVYLVMEYIPGDSLAGLRRLAREAGKELPRRVGLKILVDALHGLHAAHEHAPGRFLQLVHRDFTPSNILVGTDGVARLTDFGIAKAASRLPDPDVTRGKLRYLAPEQVRGDELDPRADVWAAGAIAWELLTGRPLYDQDDPSVLGATRGDPPRASTVATDVGGALDDAVARALSVDRERRPSSARAFAEELTAAASASGALADTREVAELVARLVEPELVERRELLEDMRKRPRSAPDVRTLIGMTGPLTLERPPLAPLPDLPPPVDDRTSELGIEVRLDRPAERAELDVLGVPSAPASQVEDEPAVFRSPVVVNETDAGGARDDVSPAGLGPRPLALPAPLAHAGAAVVRWLSPPWTTKKISIATAIGGSVLGFLLVLIALSGGKKAEANAAAASASSAAPQPFAAAAPKEAPREDAPPPVEATGEVDDEPAPILQIRANAPIAKVKVGERVVDAVVPTPTLNVDLEVDELDRTLRVTVTGTDGRVATATAQPGAHELDVTFGPRPRPAARPASTPASTVKHPWSKRSR